MFLYRFFILSGLFVLPVSFYFGDIGGSPIDVLWGDFIVLVMVVAVLYKMLRHGAPSSTALYFSFLFFCVLLAISSSLYYGSLGPIYSAARFLKSTIVFFVGCYFGRFIDIRTFYNRIPVAATVLMAILIISDILFNPAFPYGRWGGRIVNYEVYGFPNAAAGFYAAITYFLVIKALSDKGWRQGIWGVSIFIAGCICVLSLSRNAAATFFMATILPVLSIRSQARKCLYISILVMFAVGILYFYMPYLSSNLGLINKLSSTLGDNPLSGRVDVWESVLQLIAKSPLFGYGFYSFSNFGEDVKTTHNMVFDVLYKMGIVGFALYSIIIVRPIFYRYKWMSVKADPSLSQDIKHYTAFLFLLCFSGISQETLSYSTNQLLLLYMAGHITQQCKVTSLKAKAYENY